MLDRHVRSVKVAVLLASVKVAPALEGVVVEVTFTCQVAIIIVATVPGVVDIKVA